MSCLERINRVCLWNETHICCTHNLCAKSIGTRAQSKELLCRFWWFISIASINNMVYMFSFAITCGIAYDIKKHFSVLVTGQLSRNFSGTFCFPTVTTNIPLGRCGRFGYVSPGAWGGFPLQAWIDFPASIIQPRALCANPWNSSLKEKQRCSAENFSGWSTCLVEDGHGWWERVAIWYSGFELRALRKTNPCWKP